MPVPIHLDRDKIRGYLDALAAGRPIEGVSTYNDYLALAGACHFAAMTHGPVRLGEREWSELPPERREAGEEAFLDDLNGAVQFYSQVAMQVKDGEYDARFEPTADAILWTDEEGGHIVPVRGFRGQD